MQSSSRFPKVMKGTMLENLHVFHLFNGWWSYVHDGRIQYRLVEEMLLAYIFPPSFIMEPWFLAKHVLHGVRTVFYSLFTVWDKRRSIGCYFWGVFVKLRGEPFLDLLNPGMWCSNWYCSSHLGRWGDLKNERHMAKEENGSSLRPWCVELRYPPWPAYHLT